MTAALEKLGASWIKYRDRQLRGKKAGVAERTQARAHDDQGSGRRVICPRPTASPAATGVIRPARVSSTTACARRSLKLTGKDEFGYGYFASDLLPHYEQDNPEPRLTGASSAKGRSNIDASAGAVEEVARIVAQIRARWPRVEILLRANSGFARDALMHCARPTGLITSSGSPATSAWSGSSLVSSRWPRPRA